MLKSFHSDRVIHAECKEKAYPRFSYVEVFLNDNSCLKRVLRLNMELIMETLEIMEYWSSESETISFCFP